MFEKGEQFIQRILWQKNNVIDAALPSVEKVVKIRYMRGQTAQYGRGYVKGDPFIQGIVKAHGQMIFRRVDNRNIPPFQVNAGMLYMKVYIST